MNIQPNTPNIFQFEKKFHEMIYEIQRNTVSVYSYIWIFTIIKLQNS